MADLLREIFGLVYKRYRDMGDGSHAEVVAIGAGALTDAELRADAVVVSGPLTDTELRADPVTVDGDERVTSGLRVITTDHANIHNDEGFSVYVTFDDVADGATRNIVIRTESSKYVHLKFYDVWIDNASGIVQLYENPQSVADGTPLTPVNRSRLLPVVASAESVLYGATVNLTGAALLETLRFGGGGTGPQGRAGGDRSIDIEWVLNQSEDYVFLITNTSGVAADIGFWAFWYEESSG